MDQVHDRRSNDGPGYLFLNSFSSRVSDDWKYVCRRRLYACIIIHKNLKAFINSREITSLPEIKKGICGTSFQLLSKINRCSSQDSFAFQGAGYCEIWAI